MFENTAMTSLPSCSIGRCRPIFNPCSAFHGDCGSQQHGRRQWSCNRFSYHKAKPTWQGSRDPATLFSLSLFLSLSFFLSLSLSLTALRQCSGYPVRTWLESDSLFDDSGMVKWNEQNYTRVSVPTKTNSKMNLFHEKLPLRVTKETPGSQK